MFSLRKVQISSNCASLQGSGHSGTPTELNRHTVPGVFGGGGLDISILLDFFGAVFLEIIFSSTLSSDDEDEDEEDSVILSIFILDLVILPPPPLFLLVVGVVVAGIVFSTTHDLLPLFGETALLSLSDEKENKFKDSS